ncbi:TIGR02391 family protein [Arthrobacter sp. efr-133-TYG-120]|uniref:TIGR02391 family protein n=1 Tax=Arthrobacter sp. efr-133-TYG-120 TaxID=3040280 RepID=UPI00254B5249|nr:TIGR02391 family protein [Arthrobacter sp. efr-133-TYG-120]
MDVRTNSEYLEFLAKRLDEFSRTFEEFMMHHVENSGFGAMAVGIAPAVLPKDSADKARVRVLTDELNRLAGALMDLSSVTNVRLAVQGVGVLDPFVNWQRMLEPKPLLDAPVLRGLCLQAAGRLEGLNAKAEALSSPTIEPLLLHPLVWAAAQRLWNDGHLRQAVAASAEAVSGQMKQLTDRNNASDTSLWQQAFATADPQEGKARLRWPGDSDDQDVKTMQAGLLSFAPGVNMVIRNPATHVAEDFTEQDGLEQLATLSVLAKFVDRCVVVSVDGATAPEAEQVSPQPAVEPSQVMTRKNG